MSNTEPASKALAQDGQDSDQVLDFVQQVSNIVHSDEF
jgi:hypothetical protein